MATRKLAKRAAALQACKVLHQLKELDGNLLPAKRVPLHVENSEYFNFWPVEPEKQAGTTKFRRSHQVHVSTYFYQVPKSVCIIEIDCIICTNCKICV